MYLSQIVSVTVSTLNVGKRLNKQRLSKNKERNCNHKFSVRQMRLGQNTATRSFFHHSQHLKARRLYGFRQKWQATFFAFFRAR